MAAIWTQGIRRVAGVGTWLQAVLTKLAVHARQRGREAAYQRLVREIREALQREEGIRWEKAKDLRFFEATIREALRLFPPSPTSQLR